MGGSAIWHVRSFAPGAGFGVGRIPTFGLKRVASMGGRWDTPLNRRIGDEILSGSEVRIRVPVQAGGIYAGGSKGWGAGPRMGTCGAVTRSHGLLPETQPQSLPPPSLGPAPIILPQVLRRQPDPELPLGDAARPLRAHVLQSAGEGADPQEEHHVHRPKA